MKKIASVLFTLLTFLPVSIWAQNTEVREKVIYLLNSENHTATVSGCEDATTISTILIKDTLKVLEGMDLVKYDVIGIESHALDNCTKANTLNIRSKDWGILDNVDITKMRYTLKIGLGGLWYYHKGGSWGTSGEYFSVGDGSNSGHQNIPAYLLDNVVVIKDAIQNIPVKKITGNININIKNLTIPASIEEITGNALAENHLLSFNVNSSNQNYKSVNGVLFDKSGKTLVAYPAGKTETSYEVPSGVETIGMCAFGKSTNLISVTLASSVKTIEESAFNGLTNLKTIDTKNVETIGKTAFAYSGLQSITFGGALTTIGTMAFQNCKELTSVTILSNVRKIEAQAFYGCTELATVTFETPTKLTEIPANTFANCDMLTSIIIPDGIIKIGNGAFNPSGLDQITLPITASDVHENAFASDVTISRKLDLTFDENAEWTTYYSREDLTQPEGTKVYIIKGIDSENNIIPEQINYIPKETAVLIQRDSKTQTAFEASSIENPVPLSVEPWESFKGSVTPFTGISNLPGDKYVLTNDKFVKTHMETLPAFRCYIHIIKEGDNTPSSFYLSDTNKNTIILKEEGQFNRNAAISVKITGSTLEVTPIEALYVEAENITISRSTSARSGRAPLVDNNTYHPTFVKEDETTRTKTFTLPNIGNYFYEVEIDFQKRSDFSKAGTDLSISISPNRFEYDGKEHKPTDITVKWEGTLLALNTDYIIKEYKDNVNAGKGKVIVVGKGKYMGERHGEYDIAQRDINLVTFTPNPIPDQTYKGAAFTAEDLGLKITDINDAITLDDYEITYADNVNAGKTNQAKIALVAKNINYKNIKDIFFTILPKELTDEAVKTIEPQIYTGKGITPALDIKDGEIPVSDDNYDVTWADNVNVGTATATITFKNNYKGTVITTFEIKDAVLPRQIKNVYEGSAEWATYYSSENLTKPEGLTIYVVTGLEGSTPKTKEINFIPKEVAVLLQRTDKSKFTFDCETMAASTPKPEGINENLFQGTLTGISNINTINGYKYVLVNDQFIQSEEGVLSANRCYINTTTPIDGVLSLIPGKGGNDVILLEEGKENKNAGTVTVSEPKNGKVTISVTPIDVLYAETENITIIRSANARSSRAPRVDDSKVIVTAVNPTADPSGTTQYTFDYKEGYNYQVVVDFQKRKNFTKQSSKAEITVVDNQYEYNGTPCKPKNITVKWDGKELTLDKDYEISYDNNINAGKAKVIITGKRTYMATKEATFDITKRDISSVTVGKISDQTYKGPGLKIEPEVTITDIVTEGSESIIKSEDYTLIFDNNENVGKAKVTIKANNGNYKNSKTIDFNIIAKDLTDIPVQPIGDQAYTGSAITPKPIIKDGNITVPEEYYDVVYDNNIDAGEIASVIITFKGNYTGSTLANFNITEGKVTRTLNLDFGENDQWATFYSTENLEIPEGLKAYVVTGRKGGDLSITEVGFIPKEIAVLLQRTTQIAPFTSTLLPTNKKLEGVTPDKTLFQGTVEGINDLGTLSGNKFILVNDQFVQNTGGKLDGNRCFINIGDETIDGVLSLIPGKEPDDVIKLEEGKENRSAGTVDIVKKDGVATITVKPISVLYAEAKNITIIRSARARSARAPRVDDSKVTVTAVNPTADPSGTTQYTFNYKEEYDYQVIVDFQKRNDFTKQSSKAEISVKYAERVYNGSPYEPKGEDVTVKWDGETVDPAYYDISYENNTNAGKAKVIITGKRYFMNTKEATFDIKQRDIKLATVKEIADQTYTGSEIKPELDITDMVDGKNIITTDDYTLEFSSNQNVGKAKVAIVPKDLTETAVIQPIGDQPYTGSAITPTLVIKDGELIVTTENYDAVFSDNIEAGTATVNVTFKNNYKGTAKATFEIKDQVIERTLNVDFQGKAEWTTFYSAENLTLPEGIKAYVVTGLSSSNVTTAEVTFIPKNVGVLLQRTDKSKTAPFKGNTMPSNTKLEGVTPNTDLFIGTVEGLNDLGTLSGNKFILVNDQFVQTTGGKLDGNRCFINIGDETFDGVLSLIPGKEPDDVIKLEEGKENRSAGTVTVSEPKNGKVTISVTPISVLYAEAENITVIRSANARSARAPKVDDSKVTVTAVNPTADPSGTTQYIFDYKEGYDYQVVVDFQKRKDLTKQSSKVAITIKDVERVYNGSEHKPASEDITVKWDNVTVDPSNYEISYADNVNAGKAKVIITGKRYFMNTKEATFNIAQRDIKLATIEAVADQTYTGSEIKPELIIKDLNEDGANIISEDDYTLEYSSNQNVGKAKVAIVANKTNYKNIQDIYFNIVPKDITETAVIQPIGDQPYTGSAITPTLVIKDGELTVMAENYDVKYEDNIEAGTAKVNVTFKNNYKGTAKTTFEIKDQIIERTLNVDFKGSDEWATFYSEENLETPEGLKTYVITGLSGNKVNTAEVTFIPKNVGVLLLRTDKSKTAPFKGNTMPSNTKLEGVTPDTKLFQGSVEGINDLETLSGNKFILANDKFVQTVEGSLPANRCYLNTGDKVIEGVSELVIGKAATDIILLEEGKENKNAGTVTSEQKNGTVILTVTPISVLYATADNITIVKSANAGVARAPEVDDSKVKVTAVNPTADPSETTQYSFPYTEGYYYQVIVDFQKRIDLLKASYKPVVTLKSKNYEYDGTECRPEVVSVTIEVNGKTETVDPSNYEVTYEDHINAGTARAVVTGKRFLTGSTHTTFNIAQRDIKLVTVKDVADQTYTGSEIKPELTITDFNKDGVNIITEDDYTLTFEGNTNVGEAKIAIVANKTNYKNIVPKDLTETAVIQPIGDQPYTGSAITPTLVIKDGELTVGAENYDAVFSNNIEAGTATVNVTFKNNYKGTAKTTFEIKDQIIERTLNIDFKGNDEWATFYSEENLTLPEGIKAFVVTGLNANHVETTEVSFIPKNVGVLLQRTGSQSAPFHGNTMPSKTKLPDGVVPDTKLFQGTIEGINDLGALSGYKYVLVDDKFIQTSEGALSPNRCYLNTGNVPVEGVASLVIGKGPNEVIILEEGKENRGAGNISVSTPKDGLVTITVTPISVLYATVDYITVIKNVNAGNARAPEVDDSKTAVTALDATADPSGTTQYTFPHIEGYDYQITVDFQKRIDLLKASYKPAVTLETTNYIYDGTNHEPAVVSLTIVKDGKTETVDPSNYDVTYENNKDAGSAKAVITGKRVFMGGTHANFNIARRDIKLVTVKEIADQTYTGSEIQPELVITDLNDKGENIISEDDYVLEYSANVDAGKAKVAIKGDIRNYKNIQDVYFNIVPKDLTETVIIEPIEDQTYTGNAITPALVIKDGDVTLMTSSYDAVYTNNIEVGTALVDITFKGNYKGTAKTTFEIKDAIIERTLDLDFEGSAEWATYYSSENLTLPEGIKAFVVTGLNGGDLQTVEVDFIPKNVAVLLQRIADVTAPFHGNTMPSSTKLPDRVTPDTKLFCGTTTGIDDLSTISGNKYVLVNDKFTQVVDGMLPAHHCYLNTGDKAIDGTTPLVDGKSADAIILQEEGKENRNAGTVTCSEVKDGKITITVTPFVSLYALAENITVISSVSANIARAPQVDLIDDSKVEVTAVNPLADPSGTTQYTFPYTEGYHYQIIVDFQKRIDLLKAATKPVVTLDATSFDYDGTEHMPNVVSLKIGEDGIEVDPSNYDISYEGNVNAGTARVVVTGKRFLMGATHATFNIAQRDINLVTVEDIPDQEYTGAPIEPALIIKDIIEEGSESIINEDDYHLEFEDNTEIGKATVKIIANKINYKGMKKVTFNIIPTTGIQQFTVEELEGQWFDLNGQRIQNRPTQKGVYILRDKDGKVKKIRMK